MPSKDKGTARTPKMKTFRHLLFGEIAVAADQVLVKDFETNFEKQHFTNLLFAAAELNRLSSDFFDYLQGIGSGGPSHTYTMQDRLDDMITSLNYLMGIRLARSETKKNTKKTTTKGNKR